MALGKNIIEIILDLYKENFFNKINSVLDMGDQDVALKYEEIKKIKSTILGYDNGRKSVNDLYKVFLTSQNYFEIAQSMNAYNAKRFPGIRKSFNLKGEEGIYTYNFIDGKLDTVYKRISLPKKTKRTAAGKFLKSYTNEEVT